MPLDTYLELAPTYQTPGRIHVAKYARNGLVPHAVFESEIAASLNFVAAVRTKQLFHGWCGIDNIPSADYSGERVRWRFAAHTGPLLRRIKCKMLLARKDIGDPVGAPTVKLIISNADESVTYGSGSHAIGLSPASGDTPDEYIDATIQFDGVPADTDVYGRFEEINGGRLISACVYEESLGITAANGYVVPAPVSVNAPIYDARRQRMYELATRLWKRGAAHLWNFSVDSQSSPRTNDTLTPMNLIDPSVSAVSSSSPGATIDLRYCRTRSKATVPCVLAAYGNTSADETGELTITSSDGTVLANLPIPGATPAWHTTTVDMPATLDKYDLRIVADPTGDGDAVSVGAVSLYQYAA